MEPGTYKDRVLLEKNPYSLIEGIALGCYAIGVGHAFVFIRRGYETAAANRQAAAALNQAGAFRGHGVIDMAPDGPRPHRDRRKWSGIRARRGPAGPRRWPDWRARRA